MNYVVFVKEVNFSVVYKNMVTSVKMMQGSYLHKSLNVWSIYILKKSHIEISSLKTFSWTLPRHYKWR